MRSRATSSRSRGGGADITRRRDGAGGGAPRGRSSTAPSEPGASQSQSLKTLIQIFEGRLSGYARQKERANLSHLRLLVSYRPLASHGRLSINRLQQPPLDTSYKDYEQNNRPQPRGSGDRTRVRFGAARFRTFGTPSSSKYAFTVFGSAPQTRAISLISTFFRIKMGSYSSGDALILWAMATRASAS